MRTSTILTIILLFSCSLQAQKVIEKHLNFSGKESVVLDIQIADSISIQTWDKNEVYVKASVNINENKNNEAYETSFDQTGKNLIVKAEFSDHYFKSDNNCCNKSEIYWQIFIPANTRFSVETIDANITVRGETTDMDVKTISGYIDLAMPADKKADLDFSTISGTMYSNHALSLNKMHDGIPSRISEKFNAGGFNIRLETISGDIFFRKSE